MKLSLDFAFEGFRIVRHRPSVVLFWGIVMLVGNALAILLLQSLSGNALQQLSSVGQATPPSEVFALMAKLLPGYAAMIPISIVMSAVLWCAVFRIVLDGSNASFGALRFGADELRFCAVVLLFYIIVFFVYIGVVFVGAIVIGILSVAFSAISPLLGGLVAFLAIIGVIVGFIWIVGRLSLALPQSFAQKRIDMFGGWGLAKGNSMQLMVGFVVGIIMALLVCVLCFGIFVFGLILANHGDMNAMSQLMVILRNGTNIFSHPSSIAYLCFWNLILSPLMLAIFIGMPAAAYKTLAGATKGTVAQLF